MSVSIHLPPPPPTHPPAASTKTSHRSHRMGGQAPAFSLNMNYDNMMRTRMMIMMMILMILDNVGKFFFGICSLQSIREVYIGKLYLSHCHFHTFTFTLSLSRLHFHNNTFTLSLFCFHTFTLLLSYFHSHTFNFTSTLAHIHFHFNTLRRFL